MDRYTCSWIGGVNTIKMSVLPKLISTFSTTPIKIPVYSHRSWISDSKINKEMQKI